MTDKTNYAQSLMHMIKGNLGTGILAMPASFAHTGLYNAIIGLPFLCLISTYCVHLLVKSSQHLEGKTKGLNFQYASLAKHSFKSGPRWMRASSGLMCRLVDGTLLIAQMGVCCVYLVFVVDNITSILASYHIHCNKTLVFIAIFPIALLLSYIRTLKRLAIASAIANLLQMVGILLILEYLIRDFDKIDLATRDKFRPLNEVALGFGSAMFAFEGISVVLPVYTRMKHSDQMSGCFGVANLSYVILLILNFVMGLFGFLKFGHNAKDSITLNLPPEPLYDAVRAMYAISVFLTYPLQFYVPNEIVWIWANKNLLMIDDNDTVQKSTANNTASNSNSNNNNNITAADITIVRALEVVIPSIKISEKPQQANASLTTLNKEQQQQQQITANVNQAKLTTASVNEKTVISYPSSQSERQHQQSKQLVRYEYYCRTILVVITFILAISVPKLNLLMDLIGSISGTALSLILPAIIHIAAFWDDSTGLSKVALVSLDSFIITFGFIAGASGSWFSLASIVKSFSN